MAYNGKVVISIKDYKEINIVIKGICYRISSLFSIRDYDVFIRRFSETNNSRKALASVIYEKIGKSNPALPTPSLDEIEQEDESVYISFVISMVDNNEGLRKCYSDTNSDLPIIERFAIAHIAYSDLLMENLRRALSNVLKGIDYTSMLYGIQQMSKSMVMMFSNINLSVMVKNIQQNLELFSKAFSDIIAKLQVPDISDEEKICLENSYKKWGEYGWTMLPNAPHNIFESEPVDINHANKIAMMYCKSKDMENLFSEIRKQDVNKKDFEEAVFCYTNKKYKACALLLSSIIDGKNIKKQRKLPNARVGLKAIHRLENRFKEVDANSLALLHFLSYVNLFSCLSTLFSDAPGFKNEPITVNRNFISHGMSRKVVRKRDCIQLFLVLYNHFELIDFLQL